jgi:hypothetical protein
MTVRNLLTIPGVTLSLDEAGDFPALVVLCKGHTLDRKAVAECHRIAGEYGATIEFRP